MLALYAAALLLSAALLFTVQPMFARLLLPILGGAPGVWSTAQVFFQATLLAGYAYAHLSTRWLGVRRQARVHMVVLALPLLVLPLGLSRAAPPPLAQSPVPWLLLTMLVSVGPPFFALSAGGPLLQRWFAATGHARAKDPYFLYVASNLGSMLGLAAYPTLVEPSIGLSAQTPLWAWLYGVLVVIMACCAFLVGRAPGSIAPPAPATSSSPPTRRRVLRWIALAFVPCSLSLAATTHLAEDIASVPLLWILPLGIYLLTFVLAFSQRTILPRGAGVAAAPAAIVLGIVAAAAPIAGPDWLFLAVILAALFVVALVCHDELARDRPSSSQLTGFFFWVSLGGALGGAFAAIVAPLVFRSVIEYSVTLVAAAFVLPTSERPGRHRGPREPPPSEAASYTLSDVAVAAVAGIAVVAAIGAKRAGLLLDPVTVLVAFVALAFSLVVSSPRPVGLGAALGVALLAAQAFQSRADGVRLVGRSFYGAFRVTEVTGESPRRSLFHGATLHGVQAIAPDARGEPLSYYGVDGPAGQLFLRGPIPVDARVAVVGLGVGSLIAYAQPAQRWTFYEIDPTMVEIAQDSRLFTYLAEAKAPHDIVLGDARRSLAHATDTYALIVLDAYSSDAVPIHLLTREAIAIYLARLEPHGILALHISNRHLDLGRVVAALSAALGLVCLEQNAPVTASAAARGASSSHWALVARRREDLGILADDRRWHAATGRPVLWTDDRASLVHVWSSW